MAMRVINSEKDFIRSQQTIGCISTEKAKEKDQSFVIGVGISF
jgi:hypothetical protein